MIERLKEFVSEHPYLVGTGVLVVIVIFIASRGSSSGAASSGGQTTVTTVPSGPSDNVQVAQLQAATTTAANQNAAQLANNQLSAQLQVAQLDAATQQTKDTLAAQVDLAGISASSGVQLNSNNFAYQTQLSNNATQLAIVQSNNQTQQSYFQSLVSAVLGGKSAGGSSISSTTTSLPNLGTSFSSSSMTPIQPINTTRSVFPIPPRLSGASYPISTAPDLTGNSGGQLQPIGPARPFPLESGALA